MLEKIKIAAALTGFIALVSFNPTQAHAEPNDTGSGGASIESGSEPRDVGAKIDDGSGHRTVGAAIDDASEPRPDVLIPLDEDGNPILTKPVK